MQLIGPPIEVDEWWLSMWILYGLDELSDYLRNHARFDAYLETTRGEHEYEPA